ncbi:MAG: histidine kinase, partial [Acidimicrobiia bacterium]|nr:histidine kinase [Acidimicrobiia bacterium]
MGVVVLDSVVEKALEDYTRPTSLHRGGPAAVADAGRVEEILSNLLSNADKYSPLGSPVTVNVERVIGDTGDEVRVRVTDCGGGIPKNQQDVVFERFHRLGDHMTRRRGGSGLGLYISRRLVEAMGGRIWVEDPR